MRAAPLLVLGFALAGCLDAGSFDPEGRASYLDRLLAPDTEPILLVVHSVPDRQPTPPSIQALVESLASITGRPVERLPDREVPRLPDQFTVQELVAHVLPLAKAAEEGTGVYLHTFAVNGNVTNAATESGGALGLYLGQGITVAFMDDILGDLGTFAAISVPGFDQFQYKLERAVLIHEAGHAMGLVGCGTPMVRPHADPASPCHSASRDSVMWAGIHDNLADPEWVAENGLDALDYVWTFDADDHADVEAYQATLD